MGVKLPGADALGSPSSLRSGRPVISGSDYGASLVAKGVEGVGAAVAAISEDQRKQDDALDLIKADTAYQESLATTSREFDTDTDFRTYGPRFDEKVKLAADTISEGIRNPNSRERWSLRAQQMAGRERERVLNRGLSLEREHKEVEVSNVLERRQADYATTRDPIERERIIGDTFDKIRAAEATGLIRPRAAEAFRDKFLDGSMAMEMEERRQTDPEGLLKDLGAMPGSKRAVPTSGAGGLKIEPAGEHSIVHAGSGAKFRVSASYADRFAGLIADLEKEGIEVKGEQSGGYAKRNIRGTNTPSKHSHGEAIDLNWHENAEGKRGALSERLGDEKIRALAAKHGLKWGGDFKSRSRDDMHFEVDRDAVVRKELPAVGGPEDDLLPGGEPDTIEDTSGRRQYAMLSGRRRAAEIHKTRVALSNRYQEKLGSDLARIEEGGDEERDANGMTAWDRAKFVLQPNVLSKWESKRARAFLIRDGVAPLSNMNEAEAVEHIRKIGVGREDLEFSVVRDARQVAENHWERIVKQRREDPAAAVDDHPLVRKAMSQAAAASLGLVPSGADDVAVRAEVAPEVRRAQGEAVVEARQEAQRQLGISRVRQRTISKAEAEKLLDMPKPDTLSQEQQMTELSAAASRINDRFGPRIGERVFSDALALTFGGTADKQSEWTSKGGDVLRQSAAAEERFKLLAKRAFGRDITERDMRRVIDLQQIDELAALNPLAVMNPERPYMGQSFDIGRSAPKAPNDREAQVLLSQIGKYPARAAEFREKFDRRFGDGAALRTMQRAMSPDSPQP